MGGAVINNASLAKVKINGNELHMGYIPIDTREYANSGIIKPNFDLLEKYYNVNKKI